MAQGYIRSSRKKRNQPNQFVQFGFKVPAPSNRVKYQVIVTPIETTAKTKFQTAALRSSGGSISGQVRSVRKRTCFFQNGETERLATPW